MNIRITLKVILAEFKLLKYLIQAICHFYAKKSSFGLCCQWGHSISQVHLVLILVLHVYVPSQI